MQAIFDHRDELTTDISTFWFKPERTLRFTAGQFTELTLPHDNPDKRGSKRWFTVSSSPDDELVGITTRRSVEAGSSFKHTLWLLQRGAAAELAEAMGDFVLPKLVQTPLVFVAGGMGITPFYSMLRWLADTGETRPIRLLWAVRTENDIIWQDALAAAGIDATIIVSQPTASWGGLRGRLDTSTVLGLEKPTDPTDDTLIYLSGPEPMLEALQKDLTTHGIAGRQLVTDFFPGYADA